MFSILLNSLLFLRIFPLVILKAKYIITNNNSKGPSREWIDIAKTTSAKNKIRQFFNRTTKEDYINMKEKVNEQIKIKPIANYINGIIDNIK